MISVAKRELCRRSLFGCKSASDREIPVVSEAYTRLVYTDTDTDIYWHSCGLKAE